MKTENFPKLEHIDVGKIDTAVTDVCASHRDPGRAEKIAEHISKSAEVMEWLTIMDGAPPMSPIPWVARRALIMTAFSIGIECGYQLGAIEGLLAAKVKA